MVLVNPLYAQNSASIPLFLYFQPLSVISVLVLLRYILRECAICDSLDICGRRCMRIVYVPALVHMSGNWII